MPSHVRIPVLGSIVNPLSSWEPSDVFIDHVTLGSAKPSGCTTAVKLEVVIEWPLTQSVVGKSVGVVMTMSVTSAYVKVKLTVWSVIASIEG